MRQNAGQWREENGVVLRLETLRQWPMSLAEDATGEKEPSAVIL